MNTVRACETDIERSPEPGWLAVVERAFFVRAIVVAIVVGGLLTVSNQSGWIAGTETLDVLQLALVFLLPFGVVTTAQIAGAYQAASDSINQEVRPAAERVIATVSSHGIPARAIAIALVFGSVNAVAAVADTLLRSGDVTSISVIPLGQAYILPLVFGLLSQTIAYRRARFQIAPN